MNNHAEVIVLVEGQTEQLFVKRILAPYLAPRHVYLIPTILHKPGEKGGDVRFARAKKDIGKHLKQRGETWVTLLVDYYGIGKDWPGFDASKNVMDHRKKAEIMNQATAEEIQRLFPAQNQGKRFIPYVSMHEIEALYFSDPHRLAQGLGIAPQHVTAILEECGEPEKINDHKETAPSKRLGQLFPRFKKTATGIAIASEIGIVAMREACPLFHQWVSVLEKLERP